MGTELEAQALIAIGGVLARGVQAADRTWMEAVPVLAEALSGHEGEDDLAAEHQRVFGQGVFAYESVFRSAEGLRGGDHAQASAWAYGAAGLAPTEDLDSLGAQTRLWGHLLERAPDAAEAFFAEHLGVWGPAAVVAVERQGSPLYTALARLLAEIWTARMPTVHAPPEPSGDWLSDPKTSVRDIGAHMLVPTRSGWFLSRADLVRWSRTLGIPCGFGSRSQMLQGLFAGAIEHGQVGRWAAFLEEECAWWGARYDAMGAVDWGARIQRLSGDLKRVGEAAANPPPPG